MVSLYAFNGKGLLNMLMKKFERLNFRLDSTFRPVRLESPCQEHVDLHGHWDTQTATPEYWFDWGYCSEDHTLVSPQYRYVDYNINVPMFGLITRFMMSLMNKETIRFCPVFPILFRNFQKSFSSDHNNVLVDNS